MRILAASLLALTVCEAADSVTPVSASAPAAVGVGPALPAMVSSASNAATRAAVSYLIGLQMADAVAQYRLDPEKVLAAIRDKTSGKPAALTAEILESQQELMQEWGAYIDQQRQAEGESRKASNATWLATHAKIKGVITTASGLQYEVLISGKGANPKPSDTVKVHYRGTLLDGTEFDASKGEPVTFPIANLIAGWKEALVLMKVGDKWRIHVPSELAYGEDAPPKIGANQILCFDMELVDIVE